MLWILYAYTVPSLFFICRHNDIQHSGTYHNRYNYNAQHNVKMSVAFLVYCLCAECRIFIVMLSAVVPSVVKLTVVAPGFDLKGKNATKSG
jgi:hypothetical protein